MNYNELLNLSNKLGDDFFVFDRELFVRNFLDLQNSFREYYVNTHIGYSYKTNYTPYLCKIVSELGGYAEVVSDMEVEAARRLGVANSKIIYNGPSKSKASLIDALMSGIIVNLDSERDVRILLELASSQPTQKFEVAIRCNFPLVEGEISRFGIDVSSPLFADVVEQLKASSNVKLVGLHCHFPNRTLDTYAVRVDKMLALVKDIFIEAPKFINIGGGFFSKMPENMWHKFGGKPPSFKDYAAVIGRKFSDHFGSNSETKLFIEPGTALVADTFKFYCRVISTKRVSGKSIATVKGSIFTVSPTARNKELPIRVICADTYGEQEVFDIAGFTCIEGDYLSKDVSGKIAEGDFVEYSNVGSYSIVMKPPFILPASPIATFEDDKLVIIKKRESVDDVFRLFTGV